MSSVSKNLSDVLKRISDAYALVSATGQHQPRLVAVSKEKPVSMVVEAYKCGQRHFGENKIQALVEKSNASEVTEFCPEIKWHFIGRIQSNKIKLLADVRNLYMVETVDCEKHAKMLNTAWGSKHSEPLASMIQVNTSGEPQKGGVSPNEVVDFCRFLRDSCDHLKVVGVMCIGREGHDNTLSPNPDFLELVRCRSAVADELKKSPQDLELSMGMSSDFEHAIKLGSTNVRVGTTIFGERSH